MKRINKFLILLGSYLFWFFVTIYVLQKIEFQPELKELMIGIAFPLLPVPMTILSVLNFIGFILINNGVELGNLGRFIIIYETNSGLIGIIGSFATGLIYSAVAQIIAYSFINVERVKINKEKEERPLVVNIYNDSRKVQTEVAPQEESKKKTVKRMIKKEKELPNKIKYELLLNEETEFIEKLEFIKDTDKLYKGKRSVYAFGILDHEKEFKIEKENLKLIIEKLKGHEKLTVEQRNKIFKEIEVYL